MQTILTNGATANRLNMVVLAEGYTSNEFSKFFLDATNAVDALLSCQPFQEYRSYCNAFAIFVPSNESGSDHPSWPSYRDTYFNSSYDLDDRIITIPTDNLGQGKVDALVQTFVPACGLAILLVNDGIAGGSDGNGKTAIVATGYYEPYLETNNLAHETGHVLAGLGDEYTDPNPGYPDVEEPNTIHNTNSVVTTDSIKWRAWISTNTPIPTKPPDSYPSVIGLFEGAHYHTNGWYRPKLNCMMRSTSDPSLVPFCEVCSEALVLAIYQKVRPIESFAPTNASLSISSAQPVTFSLALLQPATHNISVQWFTNGAVLNGVTSPAFTLSPQSLGNGSNWVSALVKDNTPLVRTDPTNLLSQTVTWTVNVNLPQLRLDSPVWLAGGQFAFRVTGNAPQDFVIQASTNLTSWTSLTTNSLVGGEFHYTNSATAGFPRRHFRAVTPP